jgi:hypothetical protein
LILKNLAGDPLIIIIADTGYDEKTRSHFSIPISAPNPEISEKNVRITHETCHSAID